MFQTTTNKLRHTQPHFAGTVARGRFFLPLLTLRLLPCGAMH